MDLKLLNFTNLQGCKNRTIYLIINNFITAEHGIELYQFPDTDSDEDEEFKVKF